MHLIKGVRKLVGESDKRSEKASGRGLVWPAGLCLFQFCMVCTL